MTTSPTVASPRDQQPFNLLTVAANTLHGRDIGHVHYIQCCKNIW